MVKAKLILDFYGMSTMVCGISRDLCLTCRCRMTLSGMGVVHLDLERHIRCVCFVTRAVFLFVVFFFAPGAAVIEMLTQASQER